MRKCKWCGKEGEWPDVCMSTRDMEDKPHDAICTRALLDTGGGEYTVNRIAAERHAKINLDA